MYEPHDALPSPCVNVCELDARGICKGCLRTLDEIACWPSMDNPARARVLARIDREKNAWPAE